MATVSGVSIDSTKHELRSALKLIESAVQLEERGENSAKALSMYKTGVQILDKSLASISLKKNPSNDLKKIKLQMTKYRNLSLERINALTAKEVFKSSSSTKPIPVKTRSVNESKKCVLDKLKKYDKNIIKKVLDDALTDCSNISFNDIAGNQEIKEHLRETVIYPSLRPELFTGLRSPVRGILLFGPPGNGKTMLAKAVSNESKCVFLNISAASILSKWVGESENFVKVLFAVARHLEPSVIFLDELDALLMARKEESSNNVGRRVLTQFLSELDGVGTGDERVLVLGATNRPQELDDAALRRFPKRLLVPMPNESARKQCIELLLKSQSDIDISISDIQKIARATDGYSASDLAQLAKDAALGPIRDLKPGELTHISMNAVRKIQFKDFEDSMHRIRPSLSKKGLQAYVDWNNMYGDNKESTSKGLSAILSLL